VTIAGKDFGSAQGSSYVSLGTAPATVQSWGSTQIKVSVPPLSAGTYGLSVTTIQGPSNSIAFSVPLPNISGVTPGSGRPGAVVTLNGNNFGSTAFGGVVQFDATQAQVNSW